MQANFQRILGTAARTGTRAIASLGTVGLAAGAWGLAEARTYRLRRREILLPGRASPVAANADSLHARAAGETGTGPSPRLRILHLSDLHLLARQHGKQKWIASLAGLEPDLVVLTGDLIAEEDAIGPVIRTLDAFAAIPGVYVFGSNDYWAPRFKNPLTYLELSNGIKAATLADHHELPWRDMDAQLHGLGWTNLTNTRARIDIKGWSLDFVGVDDPHIDHDAYPAPPANLPKPAWPSRGHLRIGVSHAPYRRILDAMTTEGCHLILAGHTHGGQLCMPWAGALVTNCDLPRSLASGLFQWPPTGELPIRANATVNADRRPSITGLSTREQMGASRFAEADDARLSRSEWQPSPGPHRAWVNVSTGLGTSPFFPARVACAPEAIVLDILAA